MVLTFEFLHKHQVIYRDLKVKDMLNSALKYYDRFPRACSAFRFWSLQDKFREGRFNELVLREYLVYGTRNKVEFWL